MSDNLVRLKVESTEYDQKLKRAAEGLTRYADQCKRVGGTMEVVEKDTLEYVRAIGQMETHSTTATGKLGEMRRAFVELSTVYRNMSDQEKQSPVGKALSQSLDQLRGRIAESKAQLESINREIGFSEKETVDFKNVLTELGGRFGVNSDLLGLVTSGTIAYTAAIGAAATAVAVATKEWMAYNQELSRQDQVTTVTTGLTGDEAEQMTSSMRALSRTYGVDFRESVNAANTLMTQFGVTGNQAIQLLRDGMRGMIQGDGPKLLSMIQQYAPAFRDAGVSASQLVAVIQNSEGGIFTDQNMNAIVMGIRNIRLMTKSTSDALAQLGIDGQRMSQQLSNGSLSIFDALKQVAEALQNVDSGSKEAGEVMQQVFGRQGTMAGTKLGEAIATLNLNLNETKTQTGELGAAFDELEQANERLEKAIREAFGYDGWQAMATGIKTELVDALASVLELSVEIKNSWVGDIVGTMWDAMAKEVSSLYSILSNLYSLYKQIKGETADTKPADEQVDDVMTKLGKSVSRITDRPASQEPEPTDNGKPTPIVTTTTKPKTKAQPKTEEQENTAHINRLTQEYQKLATAEKNASDQQRVSINARKESIREEIAQLRTRNEELKRFAEEASSVSFSENSLPALTKQLQDLTKQQGLAESAEEWRNYQLQIEEVTRKIDVLKGKIPAGERAVISIDVNTDDLESIQDILDSTDSTVSFRADTREVLESVAQIQGIRLDTKGVNFTAEDTAVLDAVRAIDGVNINPKTLTVTAETEDAMRALMGVRGLNFDPKSVRVVAETDAARRAIETLNRQPVTAKTVTFTAEDAGVLDAVRAIDGVRVEPKTLTVTANAAEAVQQLSAVNGLTIADKQFAVTANTDQVRDINLPDEEDRTVEVTYIADTRQVLDSVAQIQGIRLDTKGVTFTAEDAAVLDAVRAIDGVRIDPKTLTVTADTAEAQRALMDVRGVNFDPKTVRIVAETSEAQQALQGVQGLTLQQKTVRIVADASDVQSAIEQISRRGTITKEVTFRAEDAGVLDAVRAIDGVRVEPKTLTVTANTAEAVQQLSAVDGLTLSDKQVTFTAEDAAVMESVRNINGVRIDTKTLTVTADTSEAVQQLSAVNGLTLADKQVTVTANTDQVRDINLPDEEDRTVAVTYVADTREVLDAVAQIQGIRIDAKDVTFTAEDAAVLDSVRAIDGVRIDPKTLTVTADTAEAQRSLMDVRGLNFDPKTVRIVAETAEAQRVMESLNRRTLPAKTVTFTADDASVLDAVSGINGIRIDTKALTVTAETAEAVRQLSAVNGLTIADKQFNITANADQVQDLMDGLQDGDHTIRYTVETVNEVEQPELEPLEQTVIISIDKQEDLDNLRKKLDERLGSGSYTIDFKEKPVLDLSGFSQASIDSRLSKMISDVKSDLREADLGSELYNNLTSRLADASAFTNLLETMLKNGIDMADFDMQGVFEKLLSGENIPDSYFNDLVTKINAKLKEAGLPSISFDAQSGNVSEDKNKKTYVQEFQKITSGLSSITGGLDKLGIELPEEIEEVIGGIQAIMSILTGIASVVTAIQSLSTAHTFLGFLGFNTGGFLPHAATGYAVPGNDFSDSTPVMVSSQELILNRSQQGNLVSQLAENDNRQSVAAAGLPYVDGETVFLGMSNYLDRAGYGEIVTTNSRK